MIRLVMGLSLFAPFASPGAEFAEKMRKFDIRTRDQLLFANWSPIGPAPLNNGQTWGICRMAASGRATTIAVNPLNPDDVWLGAAAGGAWHSPNAGVSWMPMTDDQASLAVGAIALDNCDAQAGCADVYVGTGENNIRRDTYYGAGLLIGSMSGSSPLIYSWTLSGQDIFNRASINNVVLDRSPPGDPRIYVTLSSGVTASATESTVTAPEPASGYGIYRSEDHGGSWTKLAVAESNGARPTDLEIDPQDSDVLYAGFMGRGVFKGNRNPADGSIQWCPLNAGLPVSGCPAASGLPDPSLFSFDHVEIAIHRASPGVPAILYAVLGVCPDESGLPGGDSIFNDCSSRLYRSDDGGALWTLVEFTLAAAYSRYTHALTIHPSDPFTVYFGGLTLNKSTDGGVVWSEVGGCKGMQSTALHPDHHALVFPDPSDPNRMYNASDGGFAFSTDGGASWTSGNSGLQITGFQSITASPLPDLDFKTVIGGSQDNGTNKWDGLSTVWEHANDGDAASTIMDHKLKNVMFDVYYELQPRRSLHYGACCNWSKPWIEGGLDQNDHSAFYPPMVQDPTPTDTGPDPDSSYHLLYIGSERLWKSTPELGAAKWEWLSGDAWEAVSCKLGATNAFFEDINRRNVITAIAVSPSNQDRIYMGYYDGQVFVTDAACVDVNCVSPSCWQSRSSGLPSAVITRIAVHPQDPDIAYATFSGFDLPGCAHVYKTVDAGISWNPASGPTPCDPMDPTSLPEVPANTISISAEDPLTLWLGTDIGIFLSFDAGATWAGANGVGTRRLPNVPVYEIALDEVRDRVIAGTHGRGAFVFSWDIPLVDFYEVACRPPCFLDIFLMANAVINPPIQLEVLSNAGTVLVASNIDAQGGLVSDSDLGRLVSSKGQLFQDRQGAWGSLRGLTLDGLEISELAEPLAGFALVDGAGVRVDAAVRVVESSLDPVGATVKIHGEAFNTLRAPSAQESGAQRADTPSFDLALHVLREEGFLRPLCGVSIPMAAGSAIQDVLNDAATRLNLSPGCIEKGLSTSVVGLSDDPNASDEDAPQDSPALFFSAPMQSGIQLLPSIRMLPGGAPGVVFDVDAIGRFDERLLIPTAIHFETGPDGAHGGIVEVWERSPLGSCGISVSIPAGTSAAEVATHIADAFQAPDPVGVPPDPMGACSSLVNPRDVIADGSALRMLLAREVTLSIEDSGIGFRLVSVPEPSRSCGNGIVEGGEECDDPTGGAGDICSADCQFQNDLPFSGIAEGGAIDFRLEGIELHVATVIGEDAAAVAEKVAAAINANVALFGAGLSASSAGNAVLSTGNFSQLSISDPGLESSALVPLLFPGARIALWLSLLMTASAVLWRASAVNRGQSSS